MTRRRKLWTATLTLMVLGGSIGLVMLNRGCSYTPPVHGTLDPTPYRSQRLMALAAEEAGQISDVDTRLTRQLNIANMQIRRDWKDDARITLEGARKTLSSPEAKKLNEHARISGWVSISELSRGVGDTAGAITACDGAVAAVLTIEDPAHRCQYVMGVSNELQYLRGKPAAVGFLEKAGPWTRSIDHVERRRQAVMSFAAALFNLDDFSAGQRMLRHEEDPAWRSDTLARFASMDVEYAAGSRSMVSKSASAPYYGRQLHFKDVFENKQNSDTSKD